MQLRVSKAYALVLARGAAIALVGGLAAGCSSDATRFAEGLYTGAVPSQQANNNPTAAAQPYPGDVDQTYTGSVNSRTSADVVPGGRIVPREGLGRPSYNYPAQAQQAYPAANSYPVAPARQAVQPALAPVTSAAKVERRALASAAPAAVDRISTGSTARQVAPVAITPPRAAPVSSTAQMSAPVQPSSANAGESGWTATGGTRVTLREGETIYNLSKRFGVPANEIMKVNGIANPRDVASGQALIIPTYVYSRSAPVSMPDNNPGTMAAKSSRGSKFDVPANDVPMPDRAPRDQLAVLPDVPKARERSASAPVATVNSAAAKPDATGSYKVDSGDSLYAIARKYGVSVPAIKQANGLSNGNIRVGQSLVIPSATSDATKVATAPRAANPGIDPVITGAAGPTKDKTTGSLPTYTPPVRKDEKVLQEAEKSTAAAPDATGIGKMRWPVRGRVVTAYGANVSGKASDGIDIAVPAGTPVKAAENGVVIYAGDGLKEFGNTVLVRHENGLVSVYGHNGSLTVKRGDKVRRGEEIARAGATGSADQPKLHFEIRKNSSPVNPATYLE